MLNVRSIDTVVTGSTIEMEARFDRFENAALNQQCLVIQTKLAAKSCFCGV